MKDHPYKNSFLQIYQDSSTEPGLNACFASSFILASYKAENIVLFAPKELSTLADYFLLCTVDNAVLAESLVREILYLFKQVGVYANSVEGADGPWTLIDYHQFIIHIFVGSARELYSLDHMYTQYPRIEIPSHLYHPQVALAGTSESKATKTINIKDYL